MSARDPIPAAALDDRLGFLGVTGSGKTFGAGRASSASWRSAAASSVPEKGGTEAQDRDHRIPRHSCFAPAAPRPHSSGGTFATQYRRKSRFEAVRLLIAHFSRRSSSVATVRCGSPSLLPKSLPPGVSY
jgi:hypothetical protein